MFIDPDIYRTAAKQRQRDLLDDAEQDRVAKAARGHRRQSHAQRRDKQ